MYRRKISQSLSSLKFNKLEDVRRLEEENIHKKKIKPIINYRYLKVTKTKKLKIYIIII